METAEDRDGQMVELDAAAPKYISQIMHYATESSRRSGAARLSHNRISYEVPVPLGCY